MKAVFVREFGGIENLTIEEVDEPSGPKGDEVLIKVMASAINRADILQRRGLYPAPKDAPERILGLEFSGEVIAIGEKVSKFRVGDRVFGIVSGGAQAEMIVSREDLLMKIPENLSFIEAAAIPEAFITAHDAIFTLGKLQPSESILIHAVGSGVGLAALQLAKTVNARTFGTSRSKEKLEKCFQFGLDEAILMKEEINFAEIIRAETAGKGVELIIDLVGASYFQMNLESLALKGRLILVGLTGGSKAEFNLGVALSKRLRIIGTVLRSRSFEEKVEATKKFAEYALPLFRSGKLKPNVDVVFKMNQIMQAHEYVESNKNFGKVVLVISDN
ncbi:MAG: NAD(P)H-quinone oxidoreductase [Acidobacteria bacterium]|jgi:putative PIG3 family NAD(P)H quinone oxidoreductase|nr:MAG: NAD(P)H-quinone oxidoreductase [Acidobacteriota bacterium]GIU82982.1 MAG: alcohol dehydrogenase [Pyrinomonadaceae bacterium]